MPGAENTLVTLPRPGAVHSAGEFPDFLVGHLVRASPLNDWCSSKRTSHVLH